jgi:tellurite methyltransferase
MASAAEWDARFRSGYHTGTVPDPFLVSAQEYLDLLPAGSEALDLACGSGRHAVWLAQRKLRVTAVDLSAEALAKVRLHAKERAVAVQVRQADLESPDFALETACFDLIIGFFFLHRPLFPELVRALRPGGLLIYKTYTTDQLRYPGRPRHPMHLLEPNELLRLIEGLRVWRYEECWQGRGTAAVVAQAAPATVSSTPAESSEPR